MWTCIECEHSYSSSTGDTEERMCHECLDAQYEIWMEESEVIIEISVMGGTKKIVDNFMGYLDTIFKDRKGNV